MRTETATRSEMANSMMRFIMRETTRVITGRLAKKLVIFGAGARGVVLFEMLRALGYGVSYFIDSHKNGLSVCGIPVHEPMHVMYENFDDIFVLVAADEPEGMLKALEGFGLEPGTHMDCVFDRRTIDTGTCYTPSFPLADFFLGHTRASDLPGFTCLGNGHFSAGDPGELRIVALGGSTTDPEVMDPLDRFDAETRDNSSGSWPRFFHEMLNANGIRNTVFNGGIGGYTSAQEVLKLIRDCICLKPDIVICLDGLNDGCRMYWHHGKYPKFHTSFETIENGLKPLLSGKNPGASGKAQGPAVEGISYGIEAQHSAADEWYDNQRIMNSVCREFGIKYVGFLQPEGLHGREYLESCDVKYRTGWFVWNFLNDTGPFLNKFSGADYHLLPGGIDIKQLVSCFVSDVFDYRVDHRAQFNIRYRAIEEFYEEARKLAKESNFIIDISDALYGCPEIFHDTAHCTAEGNRLIARRIYQELETKGVLAKAMGRMSEGKVYNANICEPEGSRIL